MKINLNIKKETFQNKLLEMGYNYTIIEYEKFIETIKRIIYVR